MSRHPASRGRARAHALSVVATGIVVLLLASWILAACSSSDSTAPPDDPLSPAAVTTLAATAGQDGAVTFAWTATGDDGNEGRAAAYDLRFTPLTGSLPAWSAWSEATGEPAPGEPGTVESFTVNGLTAGQAYAFGLRVGDEQQNWSDSSNTVIATASPELDTTPPAAVADLDLWASDGSSVTLAWSAPGDDMDWGTADRYALRRATAPITEETWDDATPVTDDLPAPEAPGSRQTATVTGLVADTEYHFALKTADDDDHWSEISNGQAAVTQPFRHWYIKVDGTGDAPTIQAACADSASTGDVVLVAPGRYTWSNQGDWTAGHGMLFFIRDAPGVILRSEGGPEVTILDAENQGRVIAIQGISAPEIQNVTIEGFTITNGQPKVDDQNEDAGGGGGSHLCEPIFRNCIFSNNIGGAGGGWWHGGRGGPHFENCVFEENRGTLGGAVHLINSLLASTFDDCVFRENRATDAGGGIFSVNATFEIENCLFEDNVATSLGGALSLLDNHPSVVTGCTFVGNDAFNGAAFRVRDNTELTVTRSILAYNVGGPLFSLIEGSSIDLGCSDVHGNEYGDVLPSQVVELGDNFNQNPIFCGSGAGRPYGLNTGSPCAPGNHPDGADCGIVGALPVGCAR